MPAAIEKTVAPEKQKAVKRDTARIQALRVSESEEGRLWWLKWDEHAQAEAERRRTNELHKAEREAERIQRSNTPLTEPERQRAIGLLQEERLRRAEVGKSPLTEPEGQHAIALLGEDRLQRAKMRALTEPERQRAIDNLLSPFGPSTSDDFKQRRKQDE